MSVNLPPIACKIASGAHVSHFLHPGLANTYALQCPSRISSTCQQITRILLEYNNNEININMYAIIQYVIYPKVNTCTLIMCLKN